MQLSIPRGYLSTIHQSAAVAQITSFHPNSSDHRPITAFRVVHGPRSISIRYDVQDKYVRCVRTGYQSHVFRDSCVEFFVQPKPDSGYFNFETNCGGSMLLKYIKNPVRDENGVVLNVKDVTPEQAAGIRIESSLKAPFESKGDEPINWWVTIHIPIDFMQDYVGPIADLSGQTWRANFFKCGDETPKPHFGSWAPIGEKLEFHQPDRFGTLIFE